jgi:tripartite-type tricarboxylate transporter receptor subunit TctC
MWVAARRQSAQRLSYASPSIGTTHHLAMEMFAREANARLVAITYKGGGPAVQDLLGGQVGLMFLDRATAKRTWKVASSSPSRRLVPHALRCTPTCPPWLNRASRAFNVEGWQGLTVRAGTPEPVIKAIAAAYAKAVAAPELKKKLSDAGIDTTPPRPSSLPPTSRPKPCAGAT